MKWFAVTTAILTVTLSLLLSVETSFSLGVLAVSVGVGCTLELGWDDLFNVSVLISVSASCCVAVAKEKEESRATTLVHQSSILTGISAYVQMKNTESLCVTSTPAPLSCETCNPEQDYLTACRISYAQASELVGRDSHSS